MKQLTLVVAKLSYVDLFCFIGSRAAGTEEKDSDIDFYVLINKLSMKKNFLKAVSKVLDVYGEQDNYFKYKNL